MDAIKKLSQINAITQLNVLTGACNMAKPKIEVVAKKYLLNKGDIDLIYSLLEGQKDYEWSFEIRF